MPAITATKHLGTVIIDTLERWGRAWVFLFRVLAAIVRHPPRLHLLFQQLLDIGFKSTVVVSLIGVFTGAVLAVQGEYTLSKFGAVAFTGSAVALSLIRELGPVLTALMVIGRAGSAITAEIGIMRITEQIDALRSMAVNPMQYLMAPRLLAGIIAMPLLCAIFVFIGIVGGYAVSVGLLGLSGGTFLSQMRASVAMLDLYSGAVKALAFGFIFGWVACYKGYTCGFGAVGVNRATTESVVTASVAVLVVDYFLTTVLNKVFFN